MRRRATLFGSSLVFATQSSTPAKSNTSPLVQVQGVSVTFGRQAVLRDVSLEIPRGQTLVIIGESGCGKTVLLKTMIGLVHPNQGSVQFDNKDLAKLPERDLMFERRRLGFLFQSAALFDSLTVGQNVGFPLRENTDTPAEEIDKIVLARVADVGLPESVVHKKPAELSGGMRKRVGLARALAMNPELMLYDEPTTGLDPIMSDVINELILRTAPTDVGDQRGGDTRHAHGPQSGRSYRDAVPSVAIESQRATDHLRWHSGRNRPGERPAGFAIRQRRGRRTADGDA